MASDTVFLREICSSDINTEDARISKCITTRKNETSFQKLSKKYPDIPRGLLHPKMDYLECFKKYCKQIDASKRKNRKRPKIKVRIETLKKKLPFPFSSSSSEKEQNSSDAESILKIVTVK